MAKKSALKRMKPWERLVVYLPISIFLVLILIPFWVVIVASLSDSNLIALEGVSMWPRGFTWAAYQVLFLYPQDVLLAYGVSILVTLLGTVGSLVLLIMLAYPLSRVSFSGRRILSFLLFFFMIFSAGLVPTYIFYKNYLHIYDTLLVLILPGMLPIGYVFTLRLFYESVPQSLYEAARVDGASEFRIMFTIATPLILPGLSTVAFYIILLYWNDAYTALYYTEDKRLVPIALYVSTFQNYIVFLKQQATMGGFAGVDMSNFEIPEDTLMFSIAMVASMPMLIVFLLCQKFFIGGLTSGGVKE